MTYSKVSTVLWTVFQVIGVLAFFLTLVGLWAIALGN